MDSEPLSPLAGFSDLEDIDWEALHEILPGEMSSKCDEVQFPQNPNNVQGCGTTTSNTSPIPVSPQLDICREEKQLASRKRYSREELLKLIQGVEEHANRYRRWELIKKKYFAYSDRSASQLKHEWKYIMKKIGKMKDLKEDSELMELYIRAEKADNVKRAIENVHRC